MDSSDSSQDWTTSMQEFWEEPPSARVLTHAMRPSSFVPVPAAEEAEVPEDDTIPSGNAWPQVLEQGPKGRSLSDLTGGDGFKQARLLSILETHPYYLHFLAYRGDLPLIRQFFTLSPLNLQEILDERDHRGNTVLTLATKLSHFAPSFYSIIRLLLSKGADPRQKDAYGWSALDEAVSKGDRDLVGLLFDSLHAKKQQKWEVAKAKAVSALVQLPDFSMELKWEFDSSVIPLLSKFAPHDVCKIWKSGSSLRLDMTLVGWKKLRSKRRNVSLVFKGVSARADIYLINHSKGTVVRPLEPLDQFEREAVLDDILQANAVQGELALRNCSIAAVNSSWTGRPVTAKVGKWKCTKLEALLQGAVTYTTRGQGLLLLREREYFARMTSRAVRPVLTPPIRTWERQELLQEPVDYSHFPSIPHKNDSQYQAARTGKLLLWVTTDFPMPLKDFLPVLEMLAPGNSTIQRLYEFLTSEAFLQHFSVEMFPVKLELPLTFTVKGLVTFTKMNLESVPEALMEIPNYQKVSRREGQKTLSCPRKRLFFANMAV